MYVPVLQHELQVLVSTQGIPANQELLWNNPLPNSILFMWRGSNSDPLKKLNEFTTSEFVWTPVERNWNVLGRKNLFFWYKIAYKKFLGFFFRKKGSVTFEPLSLSNFMQRIGKILRVVFKKNDSSINQLIIIITGTIL